MRAILAFLLGWLVFAASGHAEMPVLLRDALVKSAADEGRWAYTETERFVEKGGHSDGETVVRFDPSKPYGEQYTPIKINGKVPTAKQLKEYRERGKSRAEQLENGEAARDGTALDSEIEFNGKTATVDFEQARAIEETDAAITYEVPLRKPKTNGLAVERFQLHIRVNRARAELERVALRLLSPLRVMLVVKLNAGALNVDYAVLDPKFPPAPVAFSGDLAASIFFVKSSGTFEQKRSDFQRVKPYEERFGVRIGPLKALPF